MATLRIIIQNGRAKGYSVSLLGRFAFFIGFASLLFTFGCEKEETYSDIPEITYLSYKTEKGFDIIGNKVWLCSIKFDFTDGDGDFGIYDSSSTLKNCFFTQFNKIDGTFVEVITIYPQVPPSFGIPFVEPTGNKKQQKGTVTLVIALFPNPYNLQLPSDTIKYRFYVKDRALHISDTIETEEIVFDPSQKLW